MGKKKSQARRGGASAPLVLAGYVGCPEEPALRAAIGRILERPPLNAKRNMFLNMMPLTDWAGRPTRWADRYGGPPSLDDGDADKDAEERALYCVVKSLIALREPPPELAASVARMQQEQGASYGEMLLHALFGQEQGACMAWAWTNSYFEDEGKSDDDDDGDDAPEESELARALTRALAQVRAGRALHHAARRPDGGLAQLVALYAETVSLLDPPLKELHKSLFEKRHPKATRRLIAAALATRGWARAYVCWARTQGAAPMLPHDEFVAALLQVQFDAAYLVAVRRGWRRSPDALGLQGAAQLVRGNAAEAAQLLAAALSAPAEHWALEEGSEVRYLCGKWLTTARQGTTPLTGRWRRRGNAGGPAKACGPATAAVGDTTYVFGGLAGAGSGAGGGLLRRPFLCFATGATASHDDGPSAELWALDVPSGAWRKVEVAGKRPRPRAFACLAHDAGKLWLYGGRTAWSAWAKGTEHLSDTWSFDLATRKWTQLLGSNRLIHTPGPCAARGGFLYVVDSGSLRGAQRDGSAEVEAATLRRLDLDTGEWREPRASSRKTAPAICADGSGWADGGSLYVWVLEKGAKGFRAGVLWEAALDGENWGAWSTHEIWRHPADPAPGKPAARAWAFEAHQKSPVSQETAAAFDDSTGLAYVFGGWHPDNYEIGVEGHQAKCLSGRYYNVLLQVDTKRKTLRAVEPCGAEDGALGPGKRGFAFLAARGNAIRCGFGYTTFCERGGTYRDVRFLDDAWDCELLGEEAAVQEPARDFGPRRCAREGCAAADGVKLRSCTRCGVARYCSRDCQVADWPVHKLVCRKCK